MARTVKWVIILVAFAALATSAWAALAQQRLIIEVGPATPLPGNAHQWEYKIVGIQGAATLNLDDLDRLGSQGWELVGVQRDETTIVAPGTAGQVETSDDQLKGTYYYFKRMK
jgi:hypothetical protein